MLEQYENLATLATTIHPTALAEAGLPEPEEAGTLEEDLPRVLSALRRFVASGELRHLFDL